MIYKTHGPCMHSHRAQRAETHILVVAQQLAAQFVLGWRVHLHALLLLLMLLVVTRCCCC